MSRGAAFAVLALAAGVAIIAAFCAARAPAQFEYHGMCEASAAVAVGANHFLVADDQDSFLRLYERNNPSPMKFDFAGKLGIVPREGEVKPTKTDIEGAAAVGSRVYWIGSHEGAWPKQRRFFATDVIPQGAEWRIELAGEPYLGLRDALLADKRIMSLLLGNGADKRAEDAVLDIEGLAAMPDGRLLIGFRNPLSKGKALAIRFDNPHDVVMGRAAAQFGEIFELDLGNRGIRSIDRVGNDYLIIAGPVADGPKHSLYRWSGIAGEKPEMLVEIIKYNPDADFRPEALFAIPGTDKVQLLGDDGNVGGRKAECKDAKQEDKKFRSITITP